MSTRPYTSDELGTTLLEAAISAYLSGDFVAAQVLAGAAEEHLGGPHAKPAEESADDPRAHKQEARDLSLVHKHLFGEDHCNPQDPVNEVKNKVKHYNKDPLVMDAEDEAFWAIDRAIKNYALGKGTHPARTGDVDDAHRNHLKAK